MADVKVATTRVSCPTVTGTQDITVSGFGTPKAALFIFSKGITDATAVTNSGTSIGATDGTRQWAMESVSRDGQATTTNYRRGKTTKCVLSILATDGSIIGEAGFSAWITDGVRIDWTDALINANLLTVVLFGGADLSARVDAVDMGTSTSAQTYSAMGFEADLLILALNAAALTDVATAGAKISVGFVHNNKAGTITQRSMGQVEASGAIDGQPVSRMMNDKGIFNHTVNASTVVYEVGFDNFTASGFDFTCSASSTSQKFGFLALGLGGVASAVDTYNPPTTATTSTISTSFTPQFCMLGLHGCQSVDVAEQDLDAGPFGISVMSASSQFCMSTAIEDAVATTNTQSMSDDRAINLPDDGGAASYLASLTSFNASGVNLSYTVVDITTRQWIYLAIGEGTSAIAGTAASTISCTGTLTAVGSLLGASASAFGAGSSVLSGAGALLGSADMVFSESGTLDMQEGGIAGMSDMVITGSATAVGEGLLAGVAEITLVGSAVLVGAGSMSGTSDIAFVDTGMAAGDGALLGTCDLLFDAGSSVLTASGDLQGTCDLLFDDGSTTLVGTASISGTSEMTFGAGATTLTGSGAVEGAAILTFTESGTLTAPSGEMEGAAAMEFGAGSSVLTADGALAGAASMIFSDGFSNLTGDGALLGSSVMIFGSGATTLSGLITITGERVTIRGSDGQRWVVMGSDSKSRKIRGCDGQRYRIEGE